MKTAIQFYSGVKNPTVTPPGDFEQIETLLSGSSKWWGGCLAGNVIYGASRSSTTFLKIDTLTDTVTRIPGGNGHIGCNLAPNGKVYFWPDTNNLVRVLDPADDSFYNVSFPVGGSGVLGAVLHSNGKFYLCPRASNTIWEFDPATDTYLAAASTVVGGNKWRGGFLGSNNKIYFAPSTNTNWLEFDPLTSSVNYLPSDTDGVEIAQPAIFGLNGFGYSIPGQSLKVLKINITTGSTVEISGTLAGGANQFVGGSLAPNGLIFGSGFGRSEILQIDPESDTYIRLNSAAAGGVSLGSHAGLVLAPNGSQYSIPYSNTRVYKISNVGLATPAMVNMPSDISTLHLSLYNRFQNKSF